MSELLLSDEQTAQSDHASWRSSSSTPAQGAHAVKPEEICRKHSAGDAPVQGDDDDEGHA